MMNRIVLIVITVLVVPDHVVHGLPESETEPPKPQDPSSKGRGFLLNTAWSGLSAVTAPAWSGLSAVTAQVNAGVAGIKNLFFPDGSPVPANQKMATEEVSALVQYHATEIVKRGLDFNTDNGLPPIEALTYMKVEEGETDYYLINIIVSNRFIVHAKIGLPHGEGMDPSRSRLISVVGGKVETDKLDMDEFDE